MTKDEYAIWQPSPNYWPGRMGYTPKWLIIHASAGGGSVNWLDNDASGVSSHYVITQDGKEYQLVDEDASAWANGVLSTGHDAWWSNDVNPNLVTIAIECEKPDKTNQIPLTPPQQATLFALVSRICSRHGIPARPANATGGITGHFSIDPVNRSECPGTFPWGALWDYLKNIHGDATTMLSLSDPMGQYFVDAGNGRWLVKRNNISLAFAHLDFYRKYEGIFGVPLTNEIYLQQLPGTAIVVYERAIAIYDPKRVARDEAQPGAGDVYLLHIDSGIGQQIIAKPLVAALQAQISQLQAQLASKPADADIAALQSQIKAYQTALQQVASIASKAA